MLLKEKLFLANCDTVRRLSRAELEKRFLIGATFAQGVILTPSLLLDNVHFPDILARRNIETWYMGEGAQTIAIRAPGAVPTSSMTDYFDDLPPSYILNRFGGTAKGSLGRLERLDLRDDLGALDRVLARYQPLTDSRSLAPTALSDRILGDETFARWRSSPSGAADQLDRIIAVADGLHSRSAWYAAADGILGPRAAAFRTEVIDTAYHGLFVNAGEAFALDRIDILDQIPAPLLNGGMAMRQLRRQYRYIGYAVSAFNLVSALGTNEIVKYLTDEAIGYLEEKAQEQGYGWADRRDWFGLYTKLTRSIGVELK